MNYTMKPFMGIINHDSADLTFLRDVVNEIRHVTASDDQRLDAQVRSGDYFITLATTLDSLSRQISSHSVRVAIEDIVSELIHLQDDYIITKDK